MEIIRHRINGIGELQQLNIQFGVEIDIRTYQGKLVLHHELNQKGDSLEGYLDQYHRSGRTGTVIFNTKEDGIEEEILKLIEQYKIMNFFFLDLTIPTTVKLCVKRKIKNVAIRVSEYETLESALRFKGLADWIWLDSFTGQPPGLETAKRLSEHFKVCLVSPELEGYPSEKISEYKFLMPVIHGVCTKHEKLWQ
jgi:hypothetical protein